MHEDQAVSKNHDRGTTFVTRGLRDATRCEVCHQSDRFEPARDFCGRCTSIVGFQNNNLTPRFRNDEGVMIRRVQIRFLTIVCCLFALCIGPLMIQFTYFSIILGKALFSGSYEIAAHFFIPWLCTLVVCVLFGTPLYVATSMLYQMRGD